MNVYPKEVEVCIDEFDGVAEPVVAVVVPRGGAQIDADTVTATLKTMLAGYKVPKQIEIIAELPRNAMGKVQKNRLRELYG